MSTPNTNLQGLLSQLPRKNLARMGESIPEAKHENLQNFLSDSPWAAAGVWKWVGQRADQHLGGKPCSMLRIDESAPGKKGHPSVGVARQYNGRLGQLDNGQVGVDAALAPGYRATLVGTRLFLPKEWTEDVDRCQKVGVPKEEMAFRTKLELAQELVAEAVENGWRFQWVGFDSFYGRDQGLLCKLEDDGHGVVADVPADMLVWESRPPATERPAPERGGAQRVDQSAGGWRKKSDGKKVKLRTGENGPVVGRVWARWVWWWAKGQDQPRPWWLVVREEKDGTLKYTLSNAPITATVQALAHLQGQRHFIERSFEDGKSHLGMGQYQVRKWRAWQHHMALVGLAHLFVFEERGTHRITTPLLSTRDVVEMLDWYFRGQRSQHAVENAMRARHKRRARLAAAALRRARKTPKKRPGKIPK